MKKIFLVLSLVTSQLTIHADENSSSAHTLRENGKKVLAQLMAKRPAEQDFHATLPWFNGKKLEVNCTQLRNVALFISGLAAQKITFRYPIHSTTEPKENYHYHRGYYKGRDRMDKKIVTPLSRLTLVPLAIGAYGYLTSEQKMPFRIVDTQEVK